MIFAFADALVMNMAEIGVSMFGVSPIRGPTRGHNAWHVGRLDTIAVVGAQKHVAEAPLKERSWRAVNFNPL
jgi:hypothetical protein